jgi:hypothetical protein
VDEDRGERRESEDRQAAGEHRLPADAIAERPGGEEKRGERQRVALDDPLELCLGRTGVPRDRRQGDVQAGDRGDHHHQREAHDSEHRTAPSPFVLDESVLHQSCSFAISQHMMISTSVDF